MIDKLRKYVLPNLPYLFVLWVCLKLGTAYRVAAGVDFGVKLIGMVLTIASIMMIWMTRMRMCDTELRDGLARSVGREKGCSRMYPDLYG